MNRETSKQRCVHAPLLNIEAGIVGKTSMGGIEVHAKRLVEISQKRLINGKEPKTAHHGEDLNTWANAQRFQTTIQLTIMSNLLQISHEKAAAVPSSAPIIFWRKQMTTTHPVLLNVLGHMPATKPRSSTVAPSWPKRSSVSVKALDSADGLGGCFFDASSIVKHSDARVEKYYNRRNSCLAQ